MAKLTEEEKVLITRTFLKNENMDYEDFDYIVNPDKNIVNYVKYDEDVKTTSLSDRATRVKKYDEETWVTVELSPRDNTAYLTVDSSIKKQKILINEKDCSLKNKITNIKINKDFVYELSKKEMTVRKHFKKKIIKEEEGRNFVPQITDFSTVTKYEIKRRSKVKDGYPEVKKLVRTFYKG